MKPSSPVLSALTLATALAGCAAAPPAPERSRDGAPLQVMIVYLPQADGKTFCPDHAFIVDPGRRCAKATTTLGFVTGYERKDDCLDAYQNEEVEFVAVRGPVPTEAKALADGAELPDFVLDFDPFLHTNIRSENGRRRLRINEKAPPKDYSFNLSAKGCDPKDPRIVVRGVVGQ
jgi:hypothetical protein